MDTQDSENLVMQELDHKCFYTCTAGFRVSQEWTQDSAKGLAVLLWPDALEPNNRSRRTDQAERSAGGSAMKGSHPLRGAGCKVSAAWGMNRQSQKPGERKHHTQKLHNGDCRIPNCDGRRLKQQSNGKPNQRKPDLCALGRT